MASGTGRDRYEPPVGGREALLRLRLLAGLRRRFDVPVVVVSAPAGFGKTTLLAQAWEENRLDPAGDDVWLTCRADDSAASTLAEGLAHGLGIGALARLKASPADAADVIAEAVWHRSPRQVALVLDDVHAVEPESTGAALLAALLDRLPRNGHLVLAGRGAVPVALARAEVQGDVLRLGEAELSFTDGELAAFAAHRGVPPAALAGCGGWPALAELAAAVPSARASGPADVGHDYVWQEVLAGLPPDRRRELARLAPVGDVDDDLASAALGHDVDLRVLTAGLPLVSRTAGGTWSIHALLRAALARHADPAAVAAARRRAGLALAAHGDVTRAVALLTDAGADDDATRVVVEALGPARPPVPGDVVAVWLDRLPLGSPQAAVGRLLDAVGRIRSDPEAAQQGFSAAMALFQHGGDVGGELACIAQVAQLAWWWERPEQMVAMAARLFELEAAGYEPAVALACLGRALVADLANDAERTLAELDRIPGGAFNRQWESLVDWLRSLSWNHLGRPAEAEAAADRAVAGSSPLHAPLFEAARLQARWFQGHVDEVVPQLGELVDRYADVAHGNYESLGAATHALALALTGRAGDAEPRLERARRRAASRDVPLVEVNLTIAEAALHVARHDEPTAAALLQDYAERHHLLGPGHAAAPQQRTLALWYVLVPGSRPVWDTAPLGPAFATARALARAVVAVRAADAGARTDGRPAPSRNAADAGAATLVRDVEPGVVRAHLPLAWAVELALAGIRSGEAAAHRLLEALWPAAQPVVRRHAEQGSRDLSRPARAALGRLPVAPRGRLDLRLLGPMELRCDGELVDLPEWQRGRVRSLLAHLVLERPVSRERLATDLWPSLDTDAQARNLRVTLTYLLRVLEPERSHLDASFLVRAHGSGLVLAGGDHLTVDVWEFDDHHAAAVDADRQGAPSLALGPMRAAVALWRGDPTELATEEWALAEVEQRGQRLVALACRAGELLLARDEPEEAVAMATAALRVDPWADRAHLLHLAAQSARGDDRALADARALYTTALADLGLPPPHERSR